MGLGFRGLRVRVKGSGSREERLGSEQVRIEFLQGSLWVSGSAERSLEFRGLGL